MTQSDSGPPTQHGAGSTAGENQKERFDVHESANTWQSGVELPTLERSSITE